jgi:hypothetical protein
MVFWEAYLGTMERSITLNFSKPATNIIAQVGHADPRLRSSSSSPTVRYTLPIHSHPFKPQTHLRSLPLYCSTTCSSAWATQVGGLVGGWVVESVVGGYLLMECEPWRPGVRGWA